MTLSRKHATLPTQAALEKKMALELAVQDSQLQEGEITTELVEEYISISDGQVGT
jgi:hypothetical protein